MPFVSSFDIISIALLHESDSAGCLPDPKIFLCIPASAAHAAALNPNGIKTLLADGLIKFFIKGSPVFKNGPINLPPDCIILDFWVFDNLISVENLSGKALQRFVTCLLLIIIYEDKFIIR